MNDPRFRGHCYVCGKPAFEVLRKGKDGEPLQTGKPHESAVRCELVLVSGRRMTLTLHALCVTPLTENLPKHWKTVMSAFQRESGDMDEFTSRLVTDVPLGVLSVEKWSEVAR